jgi:hypothetical protein
VKIRQRNLLFLLMLVLTTAGLAKAGSYTTVTLPTADLNADLTTYTDGTAYTGLFPSTQTWNGVPFALAEVPSSGFNIIQGDLTSPNTFTIPVGVYGVSSVYTLINSAFGSFNNDDGYVEFEDSSSDTFTVQLIEGSDIRDHYNGFFVNTLSNSTAGVTTSTISYFNQNPGFAHLDEQDFTLPSAFQSATLTDIIFETNGDDGAGVPFLAAATVEAGPSTSPVPEPSSLLLLGSGLAGLAGMLRRKLKA